MPSGIYIRTEKNTVTCFKKGQASPRKGIVLSGYTKKKVSDGLKDWYKKNTQSERGRANLKPGYKAWLGKHFSDEHRKNISDSHLGEKNPLWISDRNKLKKREDRRSYAYTDWRQRVYQRDGFKCRIANADCKGRIEAHHILNWREHHELRYQINNGITLCQAHHPRKREQEAKLSPYFQKLAAEMNK